MIQLREGLSQATHEAAERFLSQRGPGKCKDVQQAYIAVAHAFKRMVADWEAAHQAFHYREPYVVLGQDVYDYMEDSHV